MLAVDLRTVDSMPSFTLALVLCQQIGGVTPKELVGPIVKDEESWSRIKSPTPRQFFPQDRLIDFMDVCSNEAPLIWLARRRGYELVPMESELERQLRVEREKRELLEQENRLMRQLLGR